MRPAYDAIARHDRDLACQLKRAIDNVGLNVGEAFGNSLGNRRLRLETARGSANEVEAALILAEAWGRATPSAEARASLRSLAARLQALAR